MSEIKTTISEQLQQLQMLMHRAFYHGFMVAGRLHNTQRGQGRVLSILKIKPEISQKELNYLLGMSKQSLAELLSKLEKKGYITREPSEDDKRVIIIKLTEEGMKASVAEDESEAFEAAKILDCLNDEELAIFSEYLNRIIKRYEEQFPNEDFEERRKHMEQFMSHYGFGRGREGFGNQGHGFGGRGEFGPQRNFGHSDHLRGWFRERGQSFSEGRDSDEQQ